LLLFFKKEALSFCSFLKKRTKKLLDDLAAAWAEAGYIKGGRSFGKSPSGAGNPMSGPSGPGSSVPGGRGGNGSGPCGPTGSGACAQTSGN
jgi:hypothetical protein